MTLKTSEAVSQVRDIQSVVHAVSGSITGITENTTGSINFGVMAGAFRLHRIQILCSQSANPTYFDAELFSAPYEKVTGSDYSYNNWNKVAKYSNLTASWTYSGGGVDRLEDRIIVIPTSGSTMAISVIPKTGAGDFIYRLWTEYAAKFE